MLTSNVFAVTGLRACISCSRACRRNFTCFTYGLAIVLVFIGIKMLMVDVYKIPVTWALLFTVTVLAATCCSPCVSRRARRHRARTRSAPSGV